MMREVLKRNLKITAARMLRGGHGLRITLLRAAAARGRALVLCYHTVGLPRADDVGVPAIHPEQFAAQMLALKSIGDIVPLDWLLQRRRPVPSRPQFAVTFDDDDTAHVDQALPILQKHQIHATFFLSGRSLHGLGPYWWTRLAHSVHSIGLHATCRAVGVHAPTLKVLVRRCRDLASVAELPLTHAWTVMNAADIRALSCAGMTIGFHTLRHQALTRLEDRDLAAAVNEGREALAAASGVPIEMFAYPYGTVDRRVTDVVRAAGYAAAFALGDRPVAAGFDRLCVPRWQPGSVVASNLAAEAALRLSRRVNRLGQGAP